MRGQEVSVWEVGRYGTHFDGRDKADTMGREGGREGEKERRREGGREGGREGVPRPKSWWLPTRRTGLFDGKVTPPRPDII